MRDGVIEQEELQLEIGQLAERAYLTGSGRHGRAERFERFRVPTPDPCQPRP